MTFVGTLLFGLFGSTTNNPGPPLLLISVVASVVVVVVVVGFPVVVRSVTTDHERVVSLTGRTLEFSTVELFVVVVAAIVVVVCTRDRLAIGSIDLIGSKYFGAFGRIEVRVVVVGVVVVLLRRTYGARVGVHCFVDSDDDFTPKIHLNE